VKKIILLFILTLTLSAEVFDFTCRPKGILEDFKVHKIKSHSIFEIRYYTAINRITDKNPKAGEKAEYYHIGYAGKMGYINNSITYIPHTWHVFEARDENDKPYYIYLKNITNRSKKNIETVAMCNAREGNRTCIISQCVSRKIGDKNEDR